MFVAIWTANQDEVVFVRMGKDKTALIWTFCWRTTKHFCSFVIGQQTWPLSQIPGRIYKEPWTANSMPFITSLIYGLVVDTAQEAKID